MSVASQPIAVAPSRLSHDIPAAYSSFSPRNLFHGSPVSLKTGSFQNRFYPGGSPGHNLGPIAMPDFTPAAWDNDTGAWLKAVRTDSVPIDDDLCRNYVCCGVALPDLHALVEHFESHHVEVIWTPYDDDAAVSPDSSSGSSPGSSTPAFDADDMDLSEPSPSPPPTPAQSAFDPVRVAMSACFRPQTTAAQFTSSYSSLAGANGASTTTTPFNRYAGYADYSSALPGTDPSPSYDPSVDTDHPAPFDKALSQPHSMPAACVPPALLFSSSASPSPLTTPASSRTGTPSPVLPLHPSTPAAPPRAPRGSSGTSLTLSKPFRCPKPGCNKSYKQQNGLKYHLSHGQCNFAPRDPAVEALSEAERERRLRPFVCAVGAVKECGRRYKNMNGLRYHYTHTGEHGTRGLEMLAQGVHPLPEIATSGSSASSSPGAPQSHQQQQPTAVSAPRYAPHPHQQQHAMSHPHAMPHPHAHAHHQVPVSLAPSPLSPFSVRVWDDLH